MARLTTLLQEGNLLQLREIAHRLKGSGGSYGFDSITSLAGTLEAGLKQEQALEETTRQLRELIDLIRTVEGYSKLAEGTATSANQ